MWRPAMKVEDIEGVGRTYANKLSDAGVSSIEDLLGKGAKRTGRKSLAEAVGVSEQRILEWVNRADLIRIKGVGSELADLLEAAGVDSPAELAGRTPANLHAKMVEINAAKKLVRQLPSEQQVQSWIAEAKGLPRVVEH
jgi:predicted flap endonuclease-1-like 5' DNA nuclease